MDNFPDPDMSTIHDTYMNDQKIINALAESRLRQKQLEIANQYAPQKNDLDIQKQQLINKYYGPEAESRIASQNALTRGRNIENQYSPSLNKLKIQEMQQKYSNPLLGSSGLGGDEAAVEYTRQRFGEDSPQYKQILDSYKNKQEFNKALTQQRLMGRSGLGAGANEEMFFQRLVGMDNPQLNSPQKIYEASNVLRSGGNTLSDGTKLNPMSKATKESFDRLEKGTTSAPLITQGVRANQADAEINAISKYAQEGLKPYGDTFLGRSPQQIMDTFKTDDESQKRLGRFIASQQLQYEIAQNEMKLANGQPGVTSTMELMHLGQQMINAKYPELSYKAREEAQKYFIEALSEGLKARKKVGFGASEVNKIEDEKPSKTKYTDEDIRHTAQKYGISEDEVRRRAGL